MLPAGEVTGKNVTGTEKFSNKINNFKKTRGYPYILFNEMEVANLFKVR